MRDDLAQAIDARQFLCQADAPDPGPLRERLRVLLESGAGEDDPAVAEVRKGLALSAMPMALKVARTVGWGQSALDASLEGLAVAAREYNPDRAAFSTYAWKLCRNTALAAARARRGPAEYASGDAMIAVEDKPQHGYEGPTVGEMLDEAGLSPRDRSVVLRVALGGETLAAIARDEGVSTERVRQIYERAKTKLREVVPRS